MEMRTVPTSRFAAVLVAAPAALSASLSLPGALAATPQDLLGGYAAQAGTPASPARGEKFFAMTHGREWSCSSCHTTRPTAAGRHASTGKPIEPLAPAANPLRFSDAAKAEKWFRRNCNDVLGRECSAGEKADVLAWLGTLKP